MAPALVVSALVLVTFDLDRPTRGEITVPAAPLISVRARMSAPARRARSGLT